MVLSPVTAKVAVPEGGREKMPLPLDGVVDPCASAVESSSNRALLLPHRVWTSRGHRIRDKLTPDGSMGREAATPSEGLWDCPRRRRAALHFQLSPHALPGPPGSSRVRGQGTTCCTVRLTRRLPR